MLFLARTLFLLLLLLWLMKFLFLLDTVFLFVIVSCSFQIWNGKKRKKEMGKKQIKQNIETTKSLVHCNEILCICKEKEKDSKTLCFPRVRSIVVLYHVFRDVNAGTRKKSLIKMRTKGIIHNFFMCTKVFYWHVNQSVFMLFERRLTFRNDYCDCIILTASLFLLTRK